MHHEDFLQSFCGRSCKSGESGNRVERTKDRNNPMGGQPADAGLHVPVCFTQSYDDIGKYPVLPEEFDGTVKHPPKLVITESRAHLYKKPGGCSFNVKFYFSNTQRVEQVRGLVSGVYGNANREVINQKMSDHLDYIGFLLLDALKDTARYGYRMNPVTD